MSAMIFRLDMYLRLKAFFDARAKDFWGDALGEIIIKSGHTAKQAAALLKPMIEEMGR